MTHTHGTWIAHCVDTQPHCKTDFECETLLGHLIVSQLEADSWEKTYCSVCDHTDAFALFREASDYDVIKGDLKTKVRRALFQSLCTFGMSLGVKQVAQLPSPQKQLFPTRELIASQHKTCRDCVQLLMTARKDYSKLLQSRSYIAPSFHN